MHIGLIAGPLCPLSNHGSPMALLRFQMAPKPIFLTSSGSRKKDPRYICLSEAKTSHWHNVWAEVSSFIPHFLHRGLSSKPTRWRCLLRVLWPVSRPVTALAWVRLKVKNLDLVPRLGPGMSPRACLWVFPRPCHWALCWLTNQWQSFFCKSRLETPRTGSGPRNLRAQPPLASPPAISLPCIPGWPGTQNRPNIKCNFGG